MYLLNKFAYLTNSNTFHWELCKIHLMFRFFDSLIRPVCLVFLANFGRYSVKNINISYNINTTINAYLTIPVQCLHCLGAHPGSHSQVPFTHLPCTQLDAEHVSSSVWIVWTKTNNNNKSNKTRDVSFPFSVYAILSLLNRKWSNRKSYSQRQ